MKYHETYYIVSYYSTDKNKQTEAAADKQLGSFFVTYPSHCDSLKRGNRLR